jgi:(p)ppGpp synthase/HD superfamily hydrolase
VSQARKGTLFPYVIHPLRVAWTVLQNGYDDEVVAAATLHDAIEDTDTTAEEIAERFGERVARLVEAVSEADKEAPWRIRKGQTVAKIAESDRR